MSRNYCLKMINYTVLAGYNVTPGYYYQINTRLFLGAKFILQNDTKGDVICSAIAFIGVRL